MKIPAIVFLIAEAHIQMGCFAVENRGQHGLIKNSDILSSDTPLYLA